MEITIITSFPNMFSGFLSNYLIKRAITKKIISIKIINLFDYCVDKRIDSRPISGGPGLIMKCQPIVNAISKNCKKTSYKILLSPKGKKFNEKKAIKFSKKKDITIICGRSEGFDERINNYIDESISIGDFILTNGEIASMVVVDSVIRLINGVISSESLLNETFNNNLLEYPQYTKPYNFNGYKVPKILYSGNHEIIKKYNRKEQLRITKKKRPDLLKRAKLDKNDMKILKKLSKKMAE